jgi:hypothetical protein
MTITLTANEVLGAVQLGVITGKEARVLFGLPAEQEAN